MKIFEWLANFILGKEQSTQKETKTTEKKATTKKRETDKNAVKKEETKEVAKEEPKEELKEVPKEEPKEEPKKEPKEENKSTDNLGKDNIKRINTVVKEIQKTLKKNYKGGKSNPFANKELHVYFTDNATFNSMHDNNFISSLEETISTELGYQFVTIKMHDTPLDKEQSYTLIVDKIYIQIKERHAVQPTKRSAFIKVIPGFGSTVDSEYELTCQDPNGKDRWNIGVGRYPNMADGSFRENYIIIDDNDHSEQFEKNKYVSRAHAYITHHSQMGYMLQVEIDGTRQREKRTRIYRAGKVIDVENIRMPETILDGDVIELSKQVRLLFTLKK